MAESGELEVSRGHLHSAILFALLGQPGDIIVDVRGQNPGFQLAEQYNVDEAERQVVNEMVQTGFQIARLRKFVDIYSNTNLHPAEDHSRSLYLAVMCDQLSDFLHVYSLDCSRLVFAFQQNPHLAVNYIRVQLSHHFTIIGELCNLVTLVSRNRLRSSELLDEVYRGTLSGVPYVCEVMQQLLRRMHDLLFQQLVQWMVYGQLPRSNGEFFIDETHDEKMPDSKLTEDTHEALEEALNWDYNSGLDAKEYDCFRVDPDKVPHVLKSYQADPHLAEKVLFVGKAIRILRVAENKQRAKQLQHAAYLVLGDATWWGTTNSKVTQLTDNPIAPDPQALMDLASPAGSAQLGTNFLPTLENSLLPNTKLSDIGVTQEDEDDIREEWTIFQETTVTDTEREWMQHHLNSAVEDHPELNMHLVHCTIDKIHKHIGKKLWVLLTKGTKLMQHLRALHDYYLCCRGDFYTHWLELSSNTLLTTSKPEDVLSSLKEYWQQARVASSADDDDGYFDRISLVVDNNPTSSLMQQAVTSENAAVTGPGGDKPNLRHMTERRRVYGAWKSILLQYRMDWPLELLLQPHIMQSYNKLFQFLTLILRNKNSLQSLCKWYSMIGRRLDLLQAKAQHKSIIPVLRSKFNPYVFLRQKMAHLVESLAMYLQVDVLEQEWCILLKRINEADDFTAADQMHQQYITALIKNCFLDCNITCQTLEDLFIQCIHLVNLSNNNLSPSNIDITSDSGLIQQLKMIDTRDVERLTKEFSRRVFFFYGLLSGKRHLPVVAGLLLRLNYNQVLPSS